MSASTFLEELSSKSLSKLTLAFAMTFVLSACGAGGDSSGGEAVDTQASTETEVEEPTPVQIDPVQISTNPQSITVEAGAVAVFTVSAMGGGDLVFQWRKNQQAIQDANSSSLSLSGVTSAEAGLYDVVVTNSVGSETSLSALLTVNEPVVVVPTVDPVVISSQPQSLSVDENSAANFSVQVTGDGDIAYQWFKNGEVILGATSSNLSFTNADLNDQGLYSVQISNSVNTVVSTQVTLNVEELIEEVVIISQPQSLSVDENSLASFSVQVTGDGDITYQWLKNGEVIDGANASTLNILSASEADVANYSVVVRNPVGPAFSEIASLNVTPIQVVSSSIELTWDIPQEREDGSDLSLGEINGYVIAYGTEQNNLSNTLSVEGASVTSTVLDELASGTYYFTIATVDSDGVQGAYSNVIQQSI